MLKKTGIASDAAGEPLKAALLQALDILDLDEGTDGTDDYPAVAERAIAALRDGRVDRLILVCGTGIGMSITANKFPGIRAALVSDIYSAQRASRSNDAQVICLGAQTIGHTVAPLLVNAWLDGEHEKERSQRKIDAISELESRLTREGGIS